MYKNILGSIGAKFLNGILNFVLTVFITQYLGAEGKGEIGIFVLNLTVILMLSDVAGGAGMVYIVPRTDVFKPFMLSYAWAFFSTALFTLAFLVFGFVPEKYIIHLFFLSLLLNLTSVNSNILLAKQLIRQTNFLLVFQLLIQVIIFLAFLFLFDLKSIHTFFYSLYGSQLIILISGLWYMKGLINSTKLQGWFHDFSLMIRYGLLVQAGNFFQLMNYRFSYYILEYFHGIAAVGIFSTGTSICEAVWIISNGISRVQYAAISNNTNREFAINISLDLSKISLVATFIGLIPFILIPGELYNIIFGEGFYEIKIALYTLFAGALALGFTSMFSHYFAGTGKAKINTMASFSGFIVTIISGFFLIPEYGLAGAGISASVSYLVISIILTGYFLRDTNIHPLQFVPRFNDIRRFAGVIKSALRSEKINNSPGN